MQLTDFSITGLRRLRPTTYRIACGGGGPPQGPHDDGIIARQHQLRSLLPHRRFTCRHVGFLRHHDQNTQNLLVQKPRCSFTLPVTPTLRGKTSLPPPRIWLDRHCRRPKTCTQPDIRRSSVAAQLAKDAHDGECYIWWSRYLPRPAQTSHRNETLWRKSGS